MAPKRFVKSADTKTAVGNSRSEIEKMLRRYGASGLSVAQDYANGRVLLSFLLPDSPAKDAPNIPVKLPISIHRVYDAMYGQPTKWDYAARTQVFDPKGYDTKRMEQAERVAWRNLVLWIDAALSASTAGLQTITEAFFAHAVVGDTGQRMVEVVEQYQTQLGVGVQRLLAAPDATTRPEGRPDA